MSIADSTSRKASISRKTRETSISVELVLDGSGMAEISTGIGFLDHMLEQLARHSLFDLKLNAAGDLHIDAHHTVEDCGWAVGAALAEALGERSGISRYGSCLLPMDEALSRVALDLSGRPWLVWHVPMTAPSLGSLETETMREFFQAFAQAGGITLHVETLHGSNSHHMIEACFKATARALRQAAAIDPRQQGRINSTKGVLGGSL